MAGAAFEQHRFPGAADKRRLTVEGGASGECGKQGQITILILDRAQQPSERLSDDILTRDADTSRKPRGKRADPKLGVGHQILATGALLIGLAAFLRRPARSRGKPKTPALDQEGDALGIRLGTHQEQQVFGVAGSDRFPVDRNAETAGEPSDSGKLRKAQHAAQAPARLFLKRQERWIGEQ